MGSACGKAALVPSADVKVKGSRSRKSFTLPTGAGRKRRKSIYSANGIVNETVMIPPLPTIGCKSQAGLEMKFDATEGTLKINQDRGIARYPFSNGYALLGVFDGHGDCGHAAAEFCITSLPTELSKRQSMDGPAAALKQAFIKVDAEMAKATDASLSGATAVACLMKHNHVTVAHCGDSRMIVLRRVKPSSHLWNPLMSAAMRFTNTRRSSRTSARASARPSRASDAATGGGKASGLRLRAHALTADHTPEHPAEKARLEALGVEIHPADATTNARVLFDGYGLAMSRSLGDHVAAAKAGVTPEPEVCEYELSEDDCARCSCGRGSIRRARGSSASPPHR